MLDSFRPPEPKNVWFLLSRHDVRRVHEKFSSRRFGRAFGCFTHFGLLSPKTFICTSNSWENFFRPIRANWWVLDSFRPPKPKNVWFLLSRHDVRRVHEKFSSRRFERAISVWLISASWAQKRLIPTLSTSCTSNSWEIFFSPIRANWWVLDSFSPPEPKNVWFLLSRHDIRRVHEKLFFRRYERAVGCFTHFGLLSPKTFDSYFIDIMYVEFMRKFFQVDSSELMNVRLISASRAQKRFIATF